MWAASSSKAVRALVASAASSSSTVITSRGVSGGLPIRCLSSAAPHTCTAGKTAHGSGAHRNEGRSKRIISDKRSNSSKAAANPGHERTSRQIQGATYAQGYQRPRFTHKGKEKASAPPTSGNNDADETRIGTSDSNVQISASGPIKAGEQTRRLASGRRDDQPPLSTSDPGQAADFNVQEETSSQRVPADTEQPSEDSLALAQNQLRAFFAQYRPPSSSVPATEQTTSQTAPLSGAVEPQPQLHSASPGPEDSSSSPPQGSETDISQQTPPTYSRPTLSDLEKEDVDQFAGIYRSHTAWDPQKDYALMQDGPERRSYLETAVEAGPRRYIVVILDGDNLLFDPRHMNQGYEGGKFVARELRLRIARKHRLIPERLDLRIRLFCAQVPLASVLNGTRVVRKDLLSDFFQGIVDSSPHNYLVNVGRGDQAADLRVKAALADALRDPGCFRAYLGGLDDFGYKEELHTIQEMGLLESKVNFIQVPGYAVQSRAYSEFAHRAIDLDYLFKRFEVALKDMQRYVGTVPGCCVENSTLPEREGPVG